MSEREGKVVTLAFDLKWLVVFIFAAGCAWGSLMWRVNSIGTELTTLRSEFRKRMGNVETYIVKESKGQWQPHPADPPQDQSQDR